MRFVRRIKILGKNGRKGRKGKKRDAYVKRL